MAVDTVKHGIPKGSAVPLAIAGVLLGIIFLSYAGVIDLPKIGKQSDYPLEPPDDSPDQEPMKLTDGKVGDPYYEDTLKQIPGQMRAKGLCKAGCKFSIDEMYLPAGLKFNENDFSISGVPIQAETWIFDLCYTDGEDQDCFNPEFSITIKPKDEVIPYRGECPTKPSPPCGTKEGEGDLVPTAVGTITYLYCECPTGTHPDPSGTVDRITPGGPFKTCLCD